ncbi:hypothetical protein [Teredinibacter sp. KSP-S5-2]|uniref:hypothetical protein n=1 Tax=Teredinibacter sp. KSP-S5-2 TaxID=3034506 RepID=UPI00293528CA|nr:hypothetical protein [Teredinibacter sp. KSP-S5-2]WNO10407.1 hypothetical protein P5V12_04410 [Teredinibacter sp. KSP-S5-2]
MRNLPHTTESAEQLKELMSNPIEKNEYYYRYRSLFESDLILDAILEHKEGEDVRSTIRYHLTQVLLSIYTDPVNWTKEALDICLELCSESPDEVKPNMQINAQLIEIFKRYDKDALEVIGSKSVELDIVELSKEAQRLNNSGVTNSLPCIFIRIDQAVGRNIVKQIRDLSKEVFRFLSKLDEITLSNIESYTYEIELSEIAVYAKKAVPLPEEFLQCNANSEYLKH